MTHPRKTDYAIYGSILEEAKKGALKNQLIEKSTTSRFDVVLCLLLEADLLKADESKLKICQNGQPRQVIYKTTQKGLLFLQRLSEIEQLLV